MDNNLINSIVEKIKAKIGYKNYNTGLVLSGGAVRGMAHLGAIKALQEKDIEADIVSGVSAGSIAGSFYCDGFEPEEILEIFRKNKIFELVKVFFNKQGLFKISGLENVLKRNLRTTNIEDLKKPLIITSTNITEGKTHYFTEGNLVDAVIASSSIPVIFKPKVIEGIHYVDGGVTNNFPVEPLRDLCNKIIGIHVNPAGACDTKKGMHHIALYCFHLSIAAGLDEKKKLLEHFIEPSELSDFAHYDLSRLDKIYEVGYKEAIKVLSE